MFTACIITTITGSDIRIIMFGGNVYPTIYKFTVRINLRCRCTVTCITVTREVFAACTTARGRAAARGEFFGGGVFAESVICPFMEIINNKTITTIVKILVTRHT